MREDGGMRWGYARVCFLWALAFGGCVSDFRQALQPDPPAYYENCLAQGQWCNQQFSNMQPSAWNKIFGLDAQHMWAVGREGTVWFWDGKAWGRYLLNIRNALYDVWGADKNHVWAVGDNLILFWNGRTWSRQALPEEVVLQGVWGVDKNHVWAAGSTGVFFWNGWSWGKVLAPVWPQHARGGALRQVWGADKNHVWVVGSHGVVFFWDGAAWTQLLLGIRADFQGVWGADLHDVWFVGETEVYFWNGQRWIEQQGPWGSDRLSQVWGITGQDVWIVGKYALYHWNGQTWTADHQLHQKALSAVWGVAADKMWGVARDGSLFSLDKDPLGQWVAMPEGLWQSHGGAWSSQDAILQDIWGADEKHVWSIVHKKVYFWNGRSWRAVFDLSEKKGLDFHLWGLDKDHVWVMGEEHMWFWDGQTWAPHVLPDRGEYDRAFRFSSIWGADAQHVWVLDDNRAGHVFFWDGNQWIVQSVPGKTSSLHGTLWGVDKNHVWLATEKGLWHWNGKTWTLQLSPTGMGPWSVDRTVLGGVDAHHVWFAAEDHIWFWNGDRWEKKLSFGQQGPFLPNFLPEFIEVVDKKHARLVGYQPNNGRNMWVWDGSQWSRQAFQDEPLWDMKKIQVSSHGCFSWAIGRGNFYRRRMDTKACRPAKSGTG